MNYDVVEDYDLLIENPLKYYHEHKDELDTLEWLSPEIYNWLMRVKFIDSIRNKEPISKCPECGGEIEVDKDKCEEYCESCGLITRNPYPYTAGQEYILPYGVRL